MLAESTTCVAALLRSPPMVLQNDLPLLLSSAAALPVLWQCGLITVYRCTDQCGERSNAAFRTQSAAEQTSLAPHDSKARLLLVTSSRGSWRSHVHRTRLRSACNSSSCKLAMLGVEGLSPRPFSWGCKGDILFLRKRISPFAASPHGVGPEAALPRCPPLRPTGAKRNSPRGLLSSRARGAKVVQIVNMGYLSPFPLFFLWIICSIDFWRFRG